MLHLVKPESNTVDPSKALMVFDMTWPWDDSPYPASFQILRDKWVIMNTGTPEEAVDYEQGPLALVRMPNDSYVKLEQIDPFDPRSTGFEWGGNWDEYTKGNMAVRDSWGGIFAAVLMLAIEPYTEGEDDEQG